MVTVSLLTITQGSRTTFLQLQIKNILAQTKLDLVKEWVIVDGSKSKEDSDCLQAFLDTLSTDKLPPIIRVEYVEGRRLGGHRNAGNAATTGDIIICVDDDDYYQPIYIEHAVATLQKSKKLIAGCGPIFLYDLHWRCVFQLDLITPYSSVNNCFCYKREYLKKHKYDANKDSGEEVEFTNSFKEPLEQLDPKSCIIQITHVGNTVFKQKLIMSSFFDAKIGYSYRKHIKITELIKNQDILDAYHNLVGPRIDSPYDIVYYAGLFSIEWDPTSTSLGGSEQAIVQLAKHWALQGKKVAVYGDLALPNAPKDMKKDQATEFIGRRIKEVYTSPEGVDYIHFSQFHPWQNFNTLILWRLYGTAPILKLPQTMIKAKQVLVDIHDNVPQHYHIIADNLEKVTHIMFKSYYHTHAFQHITHVKLREEQVVVIPNGVQVDLFKSATSETPRQPFRFCYASAYNRGIIPILKYVWPVIVKIEPRAELHLYYGVDPKNDPLKQEFYTALIGSTNVCDHGRQPLELVAREKLMSSFQLYLCESHEEIDCISVRESLVVGCIPILLNVGVFQERDGFKVQGTLQNEKSSVNIAMQILKFIKDTDAVTTLRDQLYKSHTIVDWDSIASIWPIKHS